MIYIVAIIIVTIVGGYLIRKKLSKSVSGKLNILDFELLEIEVPRSEDGSETSTSFLAFEQLYASLHGLLGEYPDIQDHFGFEMVSTHGAIRFYVSAPKRIIKFIETQIYAQYSTAKVKVVPDYATKDVLKASSYKVGVIDFAKPDYFPIKVNRDFEVDPVKTFVSTFSEVKESEILWLQILSRPIADGWQKDGLNYVKELKGEKVSLFANGFGGILTDLIKEILTIVATLPSALFGFTENAKSSAPAKESVSLSTFQEVEVNSIETKLSKLGFETVVRVVSVADTIDRVDHNLKSISAAFKQYSGSSINSFVLNIASNSEQEFNNYIARAFDPTKMILLNNEELATVFHLPSSRADAPNVKWVNFKAGEPPNNLPTEDCNYIGETLFRGRTVRFGMKNGDDKIRHMYLVGKTGTGKSTLLETMAIQDIQKGFGVGVLDPHGETIDKLLNKIPENRIDDVVLFDPSDYEHPVGLNLLEINDPTQKNLLASALLSAIKEHFDYSWGPRLEYLLNYALLTLLDVPGTTMLGITRLLEDNNYQNYILHQVKDPVVKRFWEKEFKEMKGNQKLVTEAIAPIQNKVNRFLSSSTIRNILVQKKSTIDFYDIMNNQKILLINLSKGKIGADNANLLGALLVSRIQFMALQRAKISYEERKPFYLYVDEFQNFATGSFEEILSESRKYKLGLFLTNQYTGQLPESVLKAVFGNVGTIVTFSLGAPDAKVLSQEFAPYFNDEDIISLERFHIYLKLMTDGMTSLPFSAKILRPWEEPNLLPTYNYKDMIVQKSREKYGTDREYVEDIIDRWVNRPFDKGMAIAKEHKAKKKNKEIN